MTFWRPQKPDVFEVMMLARRRVFVRCNVGHSDQINEQKLLKVARSLPSV